MGFHLCSPPAMLIMAVSLLLSILPKLPSQCYSNDPGNLGNLDSNKEIQTEHCT